MTCNRHHVITVLDKNEEDRIKVLDTVLKHRKQVPKSPVKKSKKHSDSSRTRNPSSRRTSRGRLPNPVSAYSSQDSMPSSLSATPVNESVWSPRFDRLSGGQENPLDSKSDFSGKL